MDERKIKDELDRATREHRTLEESIRKSKYELQTLGSKKRQAEVWVNDAQLKLQREQKYLDEANREYVALENKLKDFESREDDYRRKVDGFKEEFERIQRQLETRRK